MGVHGLYTTKKVSMDTTAATRRQEINSMINYTLCEDRDNTSTSLTHCGWNKRQSHYPDSTVHGANMGPIWGRQDQGGPHVGPMNFASV